MNSLTETVALFLRSSLPESETKVMNNDGATASSVDRVIQTRNLILGIIIGLGAYAVMTIPRTVIYDSLDDIRVLHNGSLGVRGLMLYRLLNNLPIGALIGSMSGVQTLGSLSVGKLIAKVLKHVIFTSCFLGILGAIDGATYLAYDNTPTGRVFAGALLAGILGMFIGVMIADYVRGQMILMVKDGHQAKSLIIDRLSVRHGSLWALVSMAIVVTSGLLIGDYLFWMFAVATAITVIAAVVYAKQFKSRLSRYGGYDVR